MTTIKQPAMANIHRQANRAQTMVLYTKPKAKATSFGFGLRPFGTGYISGTLTMANGSKPSLAILMNETTGAVIESKAVDPTTGAYLFTNLPGGRYGVVALDCTGTYRAKVVHTLVVEAVSPAVTLDPNKRNVNIVLSTDLIRAKAGATNVSVLSTVGYSSGLRYFEMKVLGTDSSTFRPCIGISRAMSTSGIDPSSVTDYGTDVGQEAGEIGYRRDGGKYINGSLTAGAYPTYGSGDVIGCAVNYTTGKGWFRKNGVFAGNPVTGTSPDFTFTPGAVFYAAFEAAVNCELEARFALSVFRDPPPTGYSAYSDVAPTPTPITYLDSLAVTPTAVWSLRKKISTATVAIRVRRSSDNQEQDIGFYAGYLDTAALMAFVGFSSAFVTTFYDQTGNGFHAVQATTSKQPRIVNAGVYDMMAVFDGADDFLKVTALTNTGPVACLYGNLKSSAGVTTTFFETSANATVNAGALSFGATGGGGNYSAIMSQTSTTNRENIMQLGLASALAEFSVCFNRNTVGVKEIQGYALSVAIPENGTVGTTECTGNFVTYDAYMGGRGGTTRIAAMSMETLVFYNQDTTAIRGTIDGIVA